MLKLVFALLGSVGTVSETQYLFPQNFKWCVATAAHQVEGGNSNSDWWDFEQTPGNIENGDQSGIAVDHWNRFEEDLGHMKDLHVNQYRFSVEWAKIEPSEGNFDTEVLEHYRMMVSRLRESGIEPFITLNHFTLPRWVRAKNAFEGSEMPELFERYVAKVYQYTGHATRDYATFNEPFVKTVVGYLAGKAPPAKTNDLKGAVRNVMGILKAHARAYHELHRLAGEQGLKVRVGMVHHLRIFDPYRRFNPMDKLIAGVFDRVFNWSIPNALATGKLKFTIPFALSVNEVVPGLKGTQDFFGLNYYSRDRFKFNLKSKQALPVDQRVTPGAPVNDLGWEIYPEGMYLFLKQIQKRYPQLPVVITENGTADHKDAFRTKFIEDHLIAVHQAIEEGVQVEGYCYWSLMDNFEWSLGFAPRFGLYEIDRNDNLRRIPRASARRFSEIAIGNGFRR